MRRAKQFCLRCRKLIDRGSLCALCKPKERKSTRDDDIYNDKRWRRDSKRYLRDNPLCIECNYPAVLVDHKIPIKQGGSVWSRDNWQSMCRSCHTVKTNKERRNNVYWNFNLSELIRTESPEIIAIIGLSVLLLICWICSRIQLWSLCLDQAMQPGF